MTFHILERFREYDLIGLPVLVRLNPNIPFKTRGNGAICVRLGKGGGRSRVVGFHNDREIRAFPTMEDEVALSPPEIIEELLSIMEEHSRLEEDNTNPGAVVSLSPVDPEHYLSCVQNLVGMREVDRVLNSLPPYDHASGGLKNGRGLTGASGAMAWRASLTNGALFPFDTGGDGGAENISGLGGNSGGDGGRDVTYEVLCYRERSRWGSTRVVDAQSVIDLDKRFPKTFSNFDEATGKPLIAPHTPCPILYGIRGEDAPELLEAKDRVRSEERYRSWLLFATNQATDDHIHPTSVPEILPYESVAVEGTVISEPETREGGHVFFAMCDAKYEKKARDPDFDLQEAISTLTGRGGDGTVEEEVSDPMLAPDRTPHQGSHIFCAAYEPTKGFRDIVRQLGPGDRIVVYGGVRQEPLTLNIEKLRVLEVSKKVRKVANPTCPQCGKSAKSAGAGAGYRCRECGKRFDEDEAVRERMVREILPGWYEVPGSARRHLAKPIKRMISQLTPREQQASDASHLQRSKA